MRGSLTILNAPLRSSWDHPRACGAHSENGASLKASGGSSPRMRGSPHQIPEAAGVCGIIPAHAGLTLSLHRYSCAISDHPRACGAHQAARRRQKGRSGSSPRMRGSLSSTFPLLPCSWDHPRACGAHPICYSLAFLHEGSSPRMRGSPEIKSLREELEGIIPAHAGLTRIRMLGAASARDHPRACGAHAVKRVLEAYEAGSSPRMRGSRLHFMGRQYLLGIIPAHAGLTCQTVICQRRARDHPRACGAHI